MYCTIQDIRSEGITEAQASDDRLTELIEMASDYIDFMTKRWFEPRDKTLKLDGTGHDILWLPIPIITVSTVKVDGQPLATTSFTAYNRPDDRNNPIIKAYNYWPKGALNVEIAGTFGYTDEDRLGNPITPRQIKHICKKLVIRELPQLGDVDAQEEKKRSRIISETTDGHSYTLANHGGEYTGDQEIDNILYLFKRPPVVGAV